MEFVSEITKEEVNALDLHGYKGKIHIIEEADEVAEVFEQINQHDYVGFDTETKPMFKKGEYNPVSLLQIAIPGHVYLIRNHKTGLTPDILRFFENKNIKKIGVALADDIKDLQKLNDFVPRSFLELNKLVKGIGIESNGLRKLTAIMLGFRISKNAQVSNWEAPSLTNKQITYAATDAWVCHEMFSKLKAMGIAEELVKG